MHTHCVACTPPVLFQVQPETKKKKSLLAQTSPALQPLPLAFCQLPIVSGLSIWPRRRRGQTYRFPYVSVLRTLTWDLCSAGEKSMVNTDGTAPAFGKCLAFKELVMAEPTGSKHEHESENFSQGGRAQRIWGRESATSQPD